MRPGTLVAIALDSIRKNTMRTLLTILGIVIGVGAVIVMIAVGQGARSRIAEQVQGLGTNLIIITPGASNQAGVSQGAGTFNRLSIEDAERLAREGPLFAGVSPVIFTRVQAIGGAGNWRTEVNGVAAEYQTIRNWAVATGTFFTDDDVRASRKVAVLGSMVAERLFPGIDPVGQRIQLRNVPFTIVGVLSPKGQTATGTDQDDVIVLPYTTVRNRLAGFSFIGQILLSAHQPGDVAAAQEEARAIMRESHRLGEGGADDFVIRTQDDLAETAQASTEVMSWLLAAIASISLLVGGIGIMNIMLVSVTERTREIGIRLAIGARKRDVLSQFIVESVVLSILGGLLGLLVGLGGAALLGALTGWSTATPPEALLIAVGFSAAVGVFFGYYPARKAAGLNPIEALRSD
jgi:putative ABC transport system permease protein